MSLSEGSNLSKQQRKKLAEAVNQSAKNKLFHFFDGLQSYAAAKAPEWRPEAKIIWREGTTRILDYGGKGKKILFIPPLINRANILDLSGEKSLMKFLVAKGYRAMLVDWGVPGEDEKEFDSENYTARLAGFCANFSDSKDLILGGYCMGGLLALKLATQIKPKALVLLATPWDFHAPDVKRVEVSKYMMEKFLGSLDIVPPEFIQSLFLTADHWRVYDKYSSSSFRRSDIVELEHWVNDGIPMSVPMARECIINWSLKNQTGKNQWLDVSNLEIPVFLGLPVKDKIVPVGCSIPLAGILPDVQIKKFQCGHVGMLTKKLCFEPIANWLEGVGS